MKKGEMGSETACVWINTSIMIVRSSKSRSEAVSLPTVDTVTCHGFGHEDHQVEDFDVQGSGNEPHRAVSALHLGEGVMKSSAGRSHGEKRNIVLPLSARRKTRCFVENQTRCFVQNWAPTSEGLPTSGRRMFVLPLMAALQLCLGKKHAPTGLRTNRCSDSPLPCRSRTLTHELLKKSQWM